jgi:WXXGXW repeat (2 copies)
MSTCVKHMIAGLLFCAVTSGAAGQVPPPPPLPDEIRPVIVEIAPPAVRVERMIARPGPSHVWARGYWDWDGRSWMWVPGRWAVAPVARATWVPAQYVRVSNGFRYVPAHWSSQRVVSVGGAGQGKALGHAKAKGKGHAKGKGKGHQKYD